MMEMEMNTELERDGGSEEAEQSSEGSSAGTIFCTLEQDFARIIKDMKSNETLAAYEAEYSRLFESLYKTHKNEDELSEKCRLLQEESMQYAERIEDLEKIVEVDEQNISKLKQEINNALKLADAAHSREQNAQETIENLRDAIKKLQQDISQKDKLASEQVTLVGKQKEGLVPERDKLTSEIETLRERVKATSKYNSELEKRVTKLETQVTETQENLDAQLNEYSKERRAKEKAEEIIQQLQEEIKTKVNELQTASLSVKTVGSLSTKLETQFKEQKHANENLQQENNKLLMKEMNMQSEIHRLNAQKNDLEKKLAESGRDNDIMKLEIQKIRDEISKYKSEKEFMSKKVIRIDRMRNSIEDELKQAQISHKNAELEVYSLQKFLEDEKKLKDKAIREKESLGKTIANLKETITSLQLEANVQDQIRKKMETNLEDVGQLIDVSKRKILYLEKERDKYSHETKELVAQVDDHMDEMRMKRAEISDLKKCLYESESKYRQLQNSFEILKAEKISIVKNLTETQDEIRELKHRLKVANKQVEQVKEEVTIKEASITNGEFLLGKAEKEKEDIKVELQTTRKTVSSLRHKIEEMKKEEKNLRQNEHQAQIEINQQKKEIDAVLVERDVLGTQLVRRNDEIALLYSKIKVLEGTIQREECQYSQKLDEIRLLKLELQKLQSEKNLLIKNMKNSSDLRLEIFHLEQNLTKERLKVTALEEELQNPLNVHRWRKLEGTDPDSFELLQKVQILQKRVLKMSSEMINKEKTIKYTEKLYANVREMLIKQPGPEVVEVLSKTQKSLVERGNKMKCILAERNMFESLTNEQTFEIERLKKELNDFKAKYFKLKKREENFSKNLEMKELTEAILPAISPSEKKIYGGGFNMNVNTPTNLQKLNT
ncbi:cilia- and flagella-associated protein 58-like [Belonocnema kinseyi]|uniref:cilia- and flagella-associated protein 58-like n=1 Tax=Belonocnema kinseyi TaxID=2817044 RepID=UPI00143D9219|nr:cilia- and flagella-associated protein 58-like [Belonocnema kinseyi]